MTIKRRKGRDINGTLCVYCNIGQETKGEGEEMRRERKTPDDVIVRKSDHEERGEVIPSCFSRETKGRRVDVREREKKTDGEKREGEKCRVWMMPKIINITHY
jgi:hypothetical protein